MATHRTPIDREAQGVTVHKVAKSQARLTLFIQGLFSHVNKIIPLLICGLHIQKALPAYPLSRPSHPGRPHHVQW